MTNFEVQVPSAFQFRSTLLSHGWIELAPFHADKDFTRLHRIHRLYSGRVIHFTVRTSDSDALVIETGDDRLDREEQEEVADAVRRIFQLDLDLSPFYELLRGDDRYGWVERRGAGRLLRSPSVWEDVAKTLLTTNTTWAMTRGMVRRLTLLGDRFDAGRSGDAPEARSNPAGGAGGGAGKDLRHAFPLPEQVASLSLSEFDAHVRAGYRSGYLHELATKIANGDVDVESWERKDLSADELYSRVKALSGFGPYAAGAVLKLLGKFDRLALDSAARSMFAREFSGGDRVLDAAISTHYQPYGKWRGLVMWMDLMGAYLRENA